MSRSSVNRYMFVAAFSLLLGVPLATGQKVKSEESTNASVSFRSAPSKPEQPQPGQAIPVSQDEGSSAPVWTDTSAALMWRAVITAPTWIGTTLWTTVAT